MMDEQREPSSSLESRLRVASAALALGVTVAEIVWLLDTHFGQRPSTLAAVYRAKRVKVAAWWKHLCIPCEAKKLAPHVIWEALNALDPEPTPEQGEQQ